MWNQNWLLLRFLMGNMLIIYSFSNSTTFLTSLNSTRPTITTTRPAGPPLITLIITEVLININLTHGVWSKNTHVNLMSNILRLLNLHQMETKQVKIWHLELLIHRLPHISVLEIISFYRWMDRPSKVNMQLSMLVNYKVFRCLQS